MNPEPWLVDGCWLWKPPVSGLFLDKAILVYLCSAARFLGHLTSGIQPTLGSKQPLLVRNKSIVIGDSRKQLGYNII